MLWLRPLGERLHRKKDEFLIRITLLNIEILKDIIGELNQLDVQRANIDYEEREDGAMQIVLRLRTKKYTGQGEIIRNLSVLKGMQNIESL